MSHSNITVEKVTITAKKRKLDLSEWTLEEPKLLKAEWHPDVLKAIEEQFVKEISDE